MGFRTFLPLAAALLAGLASLPAHARCNSLTDQLGNATVRCSDGTRGYLHTDQFGNTYGRVGDQKVNTHRDSFGNTYGRVGGKRVNTHEDAFGNTRGRIGNARVDTREDAFGNTTSRADGSRRHCFTDAAGNTLCQSLDGSEAKRRHW